MLILTMTTLADTPLDRVLIIEGAGFVGMLKDLTTAAERANI